VVTTASHDSLVARRSPLALRTRAAIGLTNAVNKLSRLAGRGTGTVAGGRVGLRVEPQLIERLGTGRPVALVSGTNGKTTTTALLAAALAGGGASVVSNTAGANMPAGHAAALAEGAGRGELDGPVVLEVDEGYVPVLLEKSAARAVVLLNLSRDQLDRTNEVRMVAGRWRAALGADATAAQPDVDRPTTVVANCDDPLVTWAAAASRRVIWVAAGARWRADASGCPACDGRLVFAGEGVDNVWSCDCGFRRPDPDVTVSLPDAGDGGSGGAADPRTAVARWRDGRSLEVRLAIPGRFNLANAVMAAAAAEVLGVPAARALEAMKGVDHVAGRFAVVEVGGVRTRLLLAKNPAGWAELLELVGAERGPLVIGINARVADGRDPSWLWDVAFEELGPRPVVATGERCRDLAVRLRYAGIAHETEPDPRHAVRRAAGAASPSGCKRADVEFVGNYTAFHDLWSP
jgi:lipid II isoglutaminyl synthase (glutamine-hydrolysing)